MICHVMQEGELINYIVDYDFNLVMFYSYLNVYLGIDLSFNYVAKSLCEKWLLLCTLSHIWNMAQRWPHKTKNTVSPWVTFMFNIIQLMNKMIDTTWLYKIMLFIEMCWRKCNYAVWVTILICIFRFLFRLRLLMWCSLLLKRFPMDTQNCSISLGSCKFIAGSFGQNDSNWLRLWYGRLTSYPIHASLIYNFTS